MENDDSRRYKTNFERHRNLRTPRNSLEEESIRAKYSHVESLWRQVTLLDRLDEVYGLGVPYQTPMPEVVMAPDVSRKARGWLVNEKGIRAPKHGAKKSERKVGGEETLGTTQRGALGKSVGSMDSETRPVNTAQFEAVPRDTTLRPFKPPLTALLKPPPQASLKEGLKTPPKTYQTFETPPETVLKEPPKQIEIILLSSSDEEQDPTPLTALPDHRSNSQTRSHAPITPNAINADSRAKHLETALHAALERSTPNSKAVIEFVLKDIETAMQESELRFAINAVMNGNPREGEKDLFDSLVKTAEETWYYQQLDNRGRGKGFGDRRVCGRSGNVDSLVGDGDGHGDVEIWDGDGKEGKLAWERARMVRGGKNR